MALADGTARIFQTVVSNRVERGHSGMPPTREHLYEGLLPKTVGLPNTLRRTENNKLKRFVCLSALGRPPFSLR